MTLSDMADFVCRKVRQTDTTSVARCKEFLSKRYELIYNDALWRDSLYLFPFTFVPEYRLLTDRPESWDSIWMMPSVVDKVVALRTDSQELQPSGQELLMRGSLDEFVQTGQPVNFTTLAPCVAILPADYDFHDLEIFGGDSGQTWTIHIIDADGNREKFTSTFPSGGTSIVADCRVVERATKQASSADVDLSTNSTDITLATCPAAETAFPVRLPIRLIPGPTDDIDLKALVKKKHIPLEDDGDAPELRNVVNCLLAFAQADMWERGRQIGKANSKFSEAGALLDQLKQNHSWQEHTQVRLVPDIDTPSGSVGDGLAGKSFW
jgi:hypothetical protein